jgi:hypothetical protein
MQLCGLSGKEKGSETHESYQRALASVDGSNLL